MALHTNTLKIQRKPEVLTSTGLSNSTLYLRIQQGLFPPGISLGARAVGWLEHETYQVLSAMAAGKNTDEIKQLVIALIEQRQQDKEV